MSINETIRGFVGNRGADIVEFVDMSVLPDAMRRGYPNAILIGTPLSKNYLRKLSIDREVDRSEFSQKEALMDRLAEDLAEFIVAKGYRAYAQSERNLANDGWYDVDKRTSTLPNKTIALLSGIGWIGKDDLLVTPQYGSGLCMCTVLTDAPIDPGKKETMASRCGACETCKNVCPEQIISGNSWEMGCSPESLLDIGRCSQCLKCLALCDWTQRYIKAREDGLLK